MREGGQDGTGSCYCYCNHPCDQAVPPECGSHTFPLAVPIETGPYEEREEETRRG